MTIAVEGALALILAGLAAIIIALAIKLFKGKRERGSRAEDALTVLDIYEGIARLEKRIETLETILLDHQQEGHKK